MDDDRLLLRAAVVSLSSLISGNKIPVSILPAFAGVANLQSGLRLRVAEIIASVDTEKFHHKKKSLSAFLLV
jgi:hypothetical protein